MNKNLDRRIHPIAEADGLSPKKLVKSEALAKYFGHQFIDIWADYLIGKS